MRERTDRYVYLGEADTAKMINPSLSPRLRSEDEARWVAHMMRRALQAAEPTLRT